MKTWRTFLLSLIAFGVIASGAGAAVGVVPMPTLSAVTNHLQGDDLGLQSGPQPPCQKTPQNCQILIVEVEVFGKDLLCSELPEGVELNGYKPHGKTSFVVSLKVTNPRVQLVSVTDDAEGTKQREYPVWVARGSTVYMTLQILSS